MIDQKEACRLVKDMHLKGKQLYNSVQIKPKNITQNITHCLASYLATIFVANQK